MIFSLPKKHFFHLLQVTFGLLLIPFLVMQFTNRVNWDVVDFVVMGCVIFGFGLVYQLILQQAHTRRKRILLGLFLLTLFLLTWAELAVGIIGSPVAGS